MDAANELTDMILGSHFTDDEYNDKLEEVKRILGERDVVEVPKPLAVRKGYRHEEGDDIPFWVVQDEFGAILAHCTEEHYADHFASLGDIIDVEA